MIKLILSGGLGNQMYQYAAGRALSLKLNTPLSINTYMLSKKSKATPRNYGLNIFDIKASLENRDSLKIKAFNLINRYSKSHSQIFNIFKDFESQKFDNRFLNITDKSTLFGYFQNEQYFANILDQLKIDFSFKVPLSSKNREIANNIKESNSISLHIRRGDYMNSDSNLKVLDTKYYHKAIESIIKKIDNPYFFVFSDDISWVKENIDLKSYQSLFIDWNTSDNSYIDMQLMSLCKHNIIANSSFSWWGAWLNSNDEKIVIVPNTWYKREDRNKYPKGFIPESWTII